MVASTQFERVRHRFTVDQYRRMGEAGIFDEEDRVELLDGEIIETTPIGSRHAGHVNRLNTLLHEQIEREVVVSVQNPLQLGEFSEPEPDLAVLRERADSYAGRLPAARDALLVVEVAESSLDDDRNTKIPLYARHGVPVVWLLDLEKRRVEVYANPSQDGYLDHSVLEGDEAVTVESIELETTAETLFV